MFYQKRRSIRVILLVLSLVFFCGSAPFSLTDDIRSATTEIYQENEIIVSMETMSLSDNLIRTAQNLAKEHRVTENGASFEEINAPGVFVEQPRRSTCTLTSVTMMLRRAAILNGMENWQQITTETVEADVWTYGVGMKDEFESYGFEAKTISLPGGAQNAAVLKNLLVEHPEGVALYAPSARHCVLLTDEKDGQFYCADTLDASIGRMKIEEAYGVTIENASSCWIITSKVNGLKTENEDHDAPKLSELSMNTSNDGSMILSCRAEDEDKSILYFTVWKEGEEANAKWYAANRLQVYHYLELNPADLEEGNYRAAVFSCDRNENYVLFPLTNTLTLNK